MIEVTMKTPLLVIIGAMIVLGAGSVLAALNNACKTGHHAWCASDIRHHVAASQK
jgi:hypothetical protein